MCIQLVLFSPQCYWIYIHYFQFLVKFSLLFCFSGTTGTLQSPSTPNHSLIQCPLARPEFTFLHVYALQVIAELLAPSNDDRQNLSGITIGS